MGQIKFLGAFERIVRRMSETLRSTYDSDPTCCRQDCKGSILLLFTRMSCESVVLIWLEIIACPDGGLFFFAYGLTVGFEDDGGICLTIVSDSAGRLRVTFESVVVNGRAASFDVTVLAFGCLEFDNDVNRESDDC